GFRVPGVVVRADVHGVGAIRGEAGRWEGIRPVAPGEARGLEVLRARGECAAVPVETGADPLDRDVHGLDARGRVGVRAAEAVRAAARVPAGVREGASGGGEGEEGARVRVVDPER